MNTMRKWIEEWIEDRTGLSKLLKVMLDEPVHGGAKWSYIFGSGLVFLFILQAVTGIVMASFYSPSSTSAWGSVYYLQYKTSFGWFVRGLHHFGSSAMMILALVHMFQVFIFGAYKKPRELNWISGVILLLFLAGFGLTGYLLPWDQKGYWATQVATNIMGTVPVIGKYAVLAGWVFWNKGAELNSPADPASNYLARPEWYFLFLFQLLKYCQGKFLIVGTVIVPALALIFLCVLPFIDRNTSRYPSKRIPFFGAVFSGLAGIIALTTLSIHHDSHDIHIIHQREDAEKQTARAIRLAARGIPPQGGLAIFLNDPVSLGEKIFKESCIGCHLVKGEGGETGPDFTDFGSREWVSELLKDPKGKKYFKESGAMPPVKQPDESLRDMAEFLLSQSGGLHNQSADRLKRGKELVLKGNCVICHPIGDKDAKKVAPNLTGYLSEEWLKEFIKNPSDPKFYGTRNKMPGFDKLSERELDALVQYLISLSKDRVLVSEKEEGNKKRKYVFGQTAPRAILTVFPHTAFRQASSHAFTVTILKSGLCRVNPSILIN